MAVDRPINYDGTEPQQSIPVDIEVQDTGDANIEIMEDGSAIVGNLPEQPDIQFGSNLAEYMEESDLIFISNELLSKVDDDKTSRKDWEETYP